MKCIGIIWNVAFQYRNEILEIISQYSISVNRHFEIDLGSQYSKFVDEVYRSEKIDEWKVKSKIYHMEFNDNRKVCIVFFEVDSKVQRYHIKKRKYVFSKLQDLKDVVRNSYKSKIKNYFFDIIFHCTETDKEFKECKEIIKKYIK